MIKYTDRGVRVMRVRNNGKERITPAREWWREMLSPRGNTERRPNFACDED